MAEQVDQMCTIRVRCPNAQAVWLARELSRWLEMRQVEPGSWEVSFRRSGGSQRFRSYVKNGRSIRLHEVYDVSAPAAEDLTGRPMSHAPGTDL